MWLPLHLTCLTRAGKPNPEMTGISGVLHSTSAAHPHFPVGLTKPLPWRKPATFILLSNRASGLEKMQHSAGSWATADAVARLVGSLSSPAAQNLPSLRLPSRPFLPAISRCCPGSENRENQH